MEDSIDRLAEDDRQRATAPDQTPDRSSSIDVLAMKIAVLTDVAEHRRHRSASARRRW